MKEEFGRLGISDEVCLDRDEFRNQVNGSKVLVRERKASGRVDWTQERWEEHLRRMKDMWRRSRLGKEKK